MLNEVPMAGLKHEVSVHQSDRVLIRPFRKEDEAMLRDMFAHSTTEDIHFRIFGAMKDFPEHMAHQFAQIDFAKEMALVATPPLSQHPTEILGIAHIITDPKEPATAEFDIMVRPDYKGHGLGYQLMLEILHYAQLRGYKAVVGYILCSNHIMLQMAHELGFKTIGFEDVATKVKVMLPPPGLMAS
jgi:acetyltransferase